MIGSTIAIDFDNFFQHIDQLKQVFLETKQCLDEVDYDEHFDPELYKASSLQENEETVLQLCFAKSPCFLVLGQSSVSKAAVVNELLGVSLLPTTIEENLNRHPFDNDGEKWRQIFIHYGSKIECSLVSRTENVNQETKISFNDDNFESGIPRHYFRVDNESGSDYSNAVLDIQLTNVLIEKSCLVVPFYDSVQKLTDVCLEWSRKSVVVAVYVVNNVILSEKDVDHLTALGRVMPKIPVFFVKSRSYVRYDLPESDRYGFASVANLTFDATTPPSPYGRPFDSVHHSPRGDQKQFICYGSPTGSEADSYSNGSQTTTMKQQLIEIGFLSSSSEKSSSRKHSKKLNFDEIFKSATDLKCDLIESGHDLPKLVWFVRQILRSHLLRMASRINMWHDNLMHLFILTAFDMARDQIITPKRIVYARNKCLDLYASLMKSTLQKQQEIEKLISSTINELKNDIIDDAGRLYVAQSLDDDVPNSSNVQEISCESCLTTEDVQRFVLVKLSKEIADRLTSSFLCLKQTFVGTLQRCLNSLELHFAGENENMAAGAALQQMLTAAYNVDLTWQTCTPLVHLLWDKMKQVGTGAAWLLLPCCPYVTRSSCCEKHRSLLSHTVGDDEEYLQPLPFLFDSDESFESMTGNRSAGGSTVEDIKWRKKVAADTLVKLSEAKLAKVLCSQFQTRIGMAHEAFQSALNKIEEYHTGRLRIAEEQRLLLRKQHAPRLAKLAMESLALRDSLLYGMPKLGLEIGRGQYGVVYQCDNWGCFGACAVKSVVPPDDKHWNDLALEFHYTKSLVEHERLVKLHGAVIDHNYGGGGGSLPAVLLIMERMKRDLHSAIRGGLNFAARLRVAIDVVEGLRFLHSQGLVHRDIKLKNVLLDDNNRAKITDLGFCKPEAMMSGSVVGTPIHMAPELFSRNYDSSVDVYAFGVLFWYICAGHVRLPQTFEQCISKDQLWNSVKLGVRPEQLSCFDAECWDIMQSCWSGDPSQRPHLGDMEPRLERLLVQYTENVNSNSAK